MNGCPMFDGIGVQDNLFEQFVSTIVVLFQHDVPSPSGASEATVERLTAASVIRHSDFIESLR
jgi:hypothetical protein